ncbi:hypothetical protein NF212_13965 [Parasalinivibrio latis]|uniref:DUF6929 family protein n=1 Tax=Parasalinivibrio latis TaxID=2952610 RepID=UPI0030DE0287
MNIRKRTILTAVSYLSLCVAGTAYAQNSDVSPSFNLKVGPSYTNTKLSSGSAMTVNGDNLIVVGDDTPWLFTVNDDYQITGKNKIANYPVNKQGRVDHKIKPDFESMTSLKYEGKDYYLVLGSGSKKELREHAFLISQNGKVENEYSLGKLYSLLHEKAGFTNKEKINIEGVAASAHKIFIFNRGNEGKNAIFEINLKDFMTFLKGEHNNLPSLKVYQMTLPAINGVQSCFSGADYWTNTNSIIFTASVEGNNNSSVNDGAVQGSFVGVLPLADLKQGTPMDMTTYMQEVTKDGKPVITKLESIAIAAESNHAATGYLVSDNDNGTSQFFTFAIDK